MKRIKKARADSTGKGEDTANDGQSFETYCTPHTNDLSSPAPDYLALMHQAQADYLKAFAGFLAEIEGAKNG